MSPGLKASASENPAVGKVRWGLNPVEGTQGVREEKPKVTPKATVRNEMPPGTRQPHR